MGTQAYPIFGISNVGISILGNLCILGFNMYENELVSHEYCDVVKHSIQI
jgi:hypothetical protein